MTTAYCAVCLRDTPEDDRLPYRKGVAHAACAIRVQLSMLSGTRFVVLAGRQGPAFRDLPHDPRLVLLLGGAS